jgi:Undecaprenyl-phosphate glucose phosphotransferase
MLYRYSEVFRTLLGVADLAVVACAWLAAYAIRFHTDLPVPLGVPPVGPYVDALAVVLPAWFLLFRANGLYEPQRTGSLLSETRKVFRVTAIGVLFLVTLSFFVRNYFYSRGVVAIFSVLAPSSLVAFRMTGRLCLRALRRRGYNLRFVLVIGGGELAEQVIARIKSHPEAGLRIRGVLAPGPGRRPIRGVPRLGGYEELKRLVRNETQRIDQVIIALPREATDQLEKILVDLDDETVNLNFVPDLLHVTMLYSSVENLDGLPVINLRETPLVGWSAIGKRIFDVVSSSLALLIAGPVMALIALGIRLETRGAVIFVQERMGIDGRVFRMFKFRTMIHNAEEISGPVWTEPNDPRRTRFGMFLRRFSFDELPQLWNVLRGDMSLVGPRPERPFFIENFRREIPGYMLRHKVKAGLTGWAQIHGLRGSTSMHDRVEHDLYYIRNWSMSLDMQILVMTLWRGISHSKGY